MEPGQDGSRAVPCVMIVAGQLHIDAAGRPIPPFLLQANQAITRGDHARAAQCLAGANLDQLRQAVAQDPSRIDLLYMLVKLLLALARHKQAEPWCQWIVELAPSHAAWFHRALICRGLPQGAPEALAWASRAFAARPDCEPYVDLYARCLVDCGRVQATLDLLETLSSNKLARASVLEGILALLLYCGRTTRADLDRGYRILGKTLSREITPSTTHQNDPDPQRRLRVGFLSPDFRRNSTAIPFEVFLDGVDPAVLQVYAYGNVARPDWVTRRIQHKVDRYIDVAGMSSAAIAELIQDHGVDILVALGGYVTDHCLEVMAYKPAPVQVDFGWVTTTGLAAVDYRITDDVLDGPETQQHYTEALMYLAGGSSVFVPPEASSLVGPLPAQHRGHVTFGSFNRRIKITGAMLESWAAILHQVPGSRFVLKSPEGQTDQLQADLQGCFQALGISSDRIDVYGACPYHDYLDIMNQVDIALDTYPFNGAITSFECLWMGVPVVTLTGELFTSRMGLNILQRLGLELFSATSVAEYIGKACAFANQIDSLAQIRRSLRRRLLSSPLCDPGRLAGEMQACLQRMWRHWCDGVQCQAGPARDSQGLSP